VFDELTCSSVAAALSVTVITDTFSVSWQEHVSIRRIVNSDTRRRIIQQTMHAGKPHMNHYVIADRLQRLRGTAAVVGITLPYPGA